MRLTSRLSGGKREARESLSAVPRVITLYRKCTSYGVQDVLIRRLHFNDLLLLLLSLDIAAARQALRQRQRNKEVGEVRDLTPREAVKFLKGGGTHG